MKLKRKLSTAIVVLGASLLGLPLPASATQLGAFTKNTPERPSGSALVQKTRSRRRGGGGRHRGNNAGAAAAGAAIGIIGGIIASEAARDHQNRVENCYRRHRRGYFYRHGERIYCDDL
jgi:hypothetical protein